MKSNKDFRECVGIIGILMITEQFLRVAKEAELPDTIRCAVDNVTAEMFEMRNSVYESAYEWLEDNMEDDGN